MPKQIRIAAGSARYVLSLLRIVAGFLVLCHGLQKVFGVLGGHRAPMPSLFAAAGFIELIGGTLIIIGLFTRATAFILSGELAVAYFKAHSPHGPVPIQNGGELAVIYSFVFLYFVFAGPGPISIDRS